MKAITECKAVVKHTALLSHNINTTNSINNTDYLVTQPSAKGRDIHSDIPEVMGEQFVY